VSEYLLMRLQKKAVGALDVQVLVTDNVRIAPIGRIAQETAEARILTAPIGLIHVPETAEARTLIRGLNLLPVQALARSLQLAPMVFRTATPMEDAKVVIAVGRKASSRVATKVIARAMIAA